MSENKKFYGQVDNITGAKKPNSKYGHAYEYKGKQIKRNKKPSSFGMNLLNSVLTGSNAFKMDKYLSGKIDVYGNKTSKTGSRKRTTSLVK